MPQATAPDPKVPWIARFARGALLRVGLLLFGLLVAVLLGEVAVRLLSSEGPTNTFRDAEIGRRFTRSWEGDCFVEEAGRPVHMHFNREGMRDRDWPEARPEGALRVAVLGDSMVAALAVEADKRFTQLPAVPSSMWQNPDNTKWWDVQRTREVHNWGVPGSSPALELRLFEARVVRYAPQVCVLTWFLGNDLSDDWQPLGGRRAVAADLDEKGELRWLPYAKPTNPFREWLVRNSRFYQWQKRMLSRLDASPEDEAPRAALRTFDTSEAPPLPDAWRMAEQVLSRFAAQARAAGVVPALLVLPCADQIYDDLWEKRVAAAAPLGWKLDRGFPGRRLKEIAERAGMSCVDVGEMALKDHPGRRLDRPADWIFIHGTWHFNEAGHALAREGLTRVIGEAMLRPLPVSGQPPR